MNLILPTSYFPPINYFALIICAHKIYIELFENYQRHTIRNRTKILTANNTIFLTVPITKGSKTIMKDVKIANDHWKKKHIMSIKSAYGSSPFFIYYFDDIKQIINRKYTFLIDLNHAIIEYFLSELRLQKDILKTEKYTHNYTSNYQDFRLRKPESNIKIKYNQVFSTEFIPNLSIMDLIFNLGPDANEYINT